MHYLICYDIASDRRRRAVVRLLEGFGDRLHESAFRARLRPPQLGQLQRRLDRLVDDVADRVTVYPLCGRDHPDVVHLGIDAPQEQPAAWIV